MTFHEEIALKPQSPELIQMNWNADYSIPSIPYHGFVNNHMKSLSSPVLDMKDLIFSLTSKVESVAAYESKDLSQKNEVVFVSCPMLLQQPQPLQQDLGIIILCSMLSWF